MISVVLVAEGDEVQRGIRQLLESDEDIKVLSTLGTILRLDPAPHGRQCPILVIGPGVVTNDTWPTVSPKTQRFHGVVVMSPTPRRPPYPEEVIEVPVELDGRILREAVRRLWA